MSLVLIASMIQPCWQDPGRWPAYSKSKEMVIMRKALILAVLLLIPAAALAQPHRFELTPYAGWRFDGEFNVDGDFLDERDVRVDEGASFGVIFDVPLNPNWQLEFLANRQNSEFIVDAGLFTPEVS